MRTVERSRDHVFVLIISSIIIVNAFLFFLSQDQTFVHIDAIVHVNKARGLFDNIEPGLRQLGTIGLPLPHLLMAPLAAIDAMWGSSAAGSLLSPLFVSSDPAFFFSGPASNGRAPALWAGSH